MRFRYGDLTISTQHWYFITILLLLLSDRLLFDLVAGDPRFGPPRFPSVDKYLAVLAVGIPLLKFESYTPFVRGWVILGYLYLFILVIESFLGYNSFFIYPHVFSKVMDMFVLFAVYGLFSSPRDKQLKYFAYLITAVFFIHMAVLKRDALNFGAFMSTERAIIAPSTYLILLPCLYFFNRYIFKERFLDLAMFFVMLGFILFLQHRTVWVAAAMSLTINIFLIKFRSAASPSVTSVMILVLVPVILGIAAFTFIFLDNPEVVEQFVARFSDITNPDAEGSTSSWRLQQFESYLPFIENHPIFGMRFEGFELPIQFFHEEAGTPLFADGSGHHFHSFYVDKMFYFGIIGLILLIVPSFYTIYRFFIKSDLNAEEITLFLYAISGIFYGLSYDWPFFYFGVVGLAMAFATRPNHDEDEEPNDEEVDKESDKNNLQSINKEKKAPLAIS